VISTAPVCKQLVRWARLPQPSALSGLANKNSKKQLWSWPWQCVSPIWIRNNQNPLCFTLFYETRAIHFVLLCFTLFYETRANVVLVRTCSICLRPHTVRHHVAPCSTTGTTAIYSRMKLMKPHENASNPKPSEPWNSKRNLSGSQCLSSKHCEWSVTGIHQLTMGCASPWQSSKPWVTNRHW
jgi:hypothetical protein